MKPDRVVVGSDDPVVADRVAHLYEKLDCVVLKTDVASAEMIKYASNAFLATKISFINEIANVCEATGADVRVVAQGMGLDKRIGPHFLQAGIGYGGSCFPKDVSALKQIAGNSGYHFQLLNAVIEVNELQKRRVIGKLKRHLGEELRGRRIALLGLAFKPNTDDIRQASSIVLASRLIAEGADVVGYDPIATENMRAILPTMTYATSALEAVKGADACVLVTEWQEFLNLDWAQVKQLMAKAVVIDGRNALDGAALADLGFSYEGVGTRPRTQ
jgi:UDPglucose 6-dehydrogenase